MLSNCNIICNLSLKILVEFPRDCRIIILIPVYVVSTVILCSSYYVCYFFACVVNQQVLVRFPGFGVEEAEWIDVRTSTLRQRSVPYKATECADVHIWDPVLCYKVL